jgi:hypothetical protein
MNFFIGIFNLIVALYLAFEGGPVLLIAANLVFGVINIYHNPVTNEA